MFSKAFIKVKTSAAAELIVCHDALREATADNGSTPAAAATANNAHVPARFSNNAPTVCDPM